jgi:hypothetical protein
MSAPQPDGADVPEVSFGPDERIQTTRLAAVGGVVAWAGTVLPAALSRHRSEVPIVWWVLSAVILVAFVALSDSLVKPQPSDRVFAVVIVVASIAAVFVYGADSITPVFLVLSAGVVGWGSSPRFLIGIGVLQTAALVLALVLQGGTVVWAVVYAALMFFAGLMVTVVVREGSRATRHTKPRRRSRRPTSGSVRSTPIWLRPKPGSLRRARRRSGCGSPATCTTAWVIR